MTTGTHHITAVAMLVSAQGPILGPLDIQVTTAPATGTDSADSIPVIGGVLKTSASDRRGHAPKANGPTPSGVGPLS
ncbi:hypothetical protein [Nocardia sp. NPDC004860]|uniref:hypothetical protein n=1 Tax=Nocardia sp. NPDC004860 TaxID=3154557 RepID=UPI0033B1825D